MSQDTSCSRLLILPTELIGNIIAHVSQLCQQSSCNEGRRLRQSCKTLNEAVSLHWPRLTITLDDDCNPCSEEELYSVLRRRKSKLEVVMHYGNQTCREDGAGGSEEDNGFITYLFEYVPTCAAVQQLSFTSHTDGHAPRHHLSWPSSRTELLCDCFPSLTALSVSGFLLGSGALAGLVDASQQLGLQQLHVRLCAMKEPRRYTRVKAVPLRNVFRGRRLQQLSLDIWWQDVGLPRLQPLARHLTHLTLALPAGYRSAEDCLPLVQGLSQLRVLNLTMPAPLPPLYDSWSQRYNDDADDEAWGEEAGEKEEGEREEGEEAGEQAGEEEVEEEAGEEEERDESQHYELDFTGLPQLVHSLPSLQSLGLPCLLIHDDDMEVLLAITQITHIIPLCQTQLSRSYADDACSWRHLQCQDVVGPEQLQTLAYLPLHSLTHPLHIPKLLLDANQDDLDLATAAVKNMALRCKAPVIIGSLTLRCPTAPQAASTDGHMQLAVVEALVAQLQPIVIKDVKVMGLHSVTPSTVRALAPACRAASRVTLHGGPMAPGLEVWLEMLRCMPATTHLDITGLSSHLGDMEEGLWWLRRQPRRPGGLEISLWAPGTSKTRPRHWRQLTCKRGFPRIIRRERTGN